MKDAAAIFAYVSQRHRQLHDQLLQARRTGDKSFVAIVSSKMTELRDLGRFIRGGDPEDDGNPFYDSEDY
jgi:hypothetical protein